MRLIENSPRVPKVQAIKIKARETESGSIRHITPNDDKQNEKTHWRLKRGTACIPPNKDLVLSIPMYKRTSASGVGGVAGSSLKSNIPQW